MQHTIRLLTLMRSIAVIIGFGIAFASAHALAQTNTNSFGDRFIPQWEEDFTKETSLNTQRWHLWFAMKMPTFDRKFGMIVPPDGFLGTALSATPYDHNGNFGNSDASKAYLGTTLFGRYAARMYTNTLTGQNQSFWLVKPVFTNDDWNEIDLEIFNADFVKTGSIIPIYSLHFGDWQPLISQPTARDPSVVQVPGWHDWVIEWTPNYVAWYCDGQRRNVYFNSSWKPDWNERNGTGVESQLFPQSTMFANQGRPPKNGGGEMSVAWTSYSSLDMQSFTAASFARKSGGTVARDTKTILNAPDTGNLYVGSLKTGDYLRYDNVDTKWRNISIQIDASAAGRQIQVRTGSRNGPIIGTIDIPVTRGPEWIYDDLAIQDDPTQIASPMRKFATCNASLEIGKILTITGGQGFTPGNYTVKAINIVKDESIHAVAALDRPVGKPKSTKGQGILHYQDPIRYTLASADLKPRTGRPQDIYLTFTGGDGGFSVYNIYFFGTEPTSRK